MSIAKELIVDVVIENDIKFPKTSIAELYETGLIGGKAIAIIPDYMNDSTIASDGDFLKGVNKPGLTELVNQILPQVQLQLEGVMKNAEIVFKNINNLFDEETKKELKYSIQNFSLLTSNLNNTSKNISDLINKNSNNFSSAILDFKNASKNIRSISDSISGKEITNITNNLNELLNNLKIISNNLNNSKGSIGKLINDDSIYSNLEKASNELNILIEDIKINPGRYIKFSVFGRKNKEFKNNN